MANRSTFPDSIDTFIEHLDISYNDITNVNRYKELKLKANRTTDENTELNTLTTQLRDKILSPEDFNKLQDSMTNIQNQLKGDFLDVITTEKNDALTAIDNKMASVITYLDGTTAGNLQNQIGILSNLTTTNKTSLVNAVNEVKSNIPTMPTSLPANGGNADTVDNKHASEFALVNHTHSYNEYEFIADANNALFSGTKKADSLTWNGQCVYANTSTTVAVQLTDIKFTNLRFGDYAMIVRIRSANNALTTDAIKLDVQKNVSGTFTSIASGLIQAKDFVSITDYKCFLLNFEYKGAKATNNELKLVITLQTQASAYEVALDYIQVMPVTLGAMNFI